MTELQATSDPPSAVNSSSPPSGERSAAGLRWAIPLLMVLGGLAGGAGSQMIFQVRELFRVAPERLGMPPYSPQLEREMLLCGIANHALGFASFGLLLCGMVGLGLGALSGSRGAAVRLLLVGGILGLLGGAAGGAAAFLIDNAFVVVPLDGLFKAILIHLPNWLLLALAIAIAATLLRQHRVPAAKLFVSAIVAAFFAALLYPLLGLLLFPAANSDRPVPFEMGLRLLCFAVGGAVLAGGAARWLRSSSPVTA